MANKSLAQFYEDFNEEIQVSYETDSSGWNKEDFFTSIMLEYLEDAGEVNDSIMCPFRGYGLQLNAYSIAEDFSTLDIFVSIYLESDKPKTVSQTDVDAAVKRAIQLYHKAINDLYTSFQKDNDTYEFAITLHDHKNDIKIVRICALTNGTVKPINFKNITISEAEVSFSIWDIDRLYRCVMSGKMRETIEIDFQEKYNLTIPCIENSSSDKYSVYLAIISGELLAALYDEYRDRLLEKNVRSFLQVKGAVNKGIRDTLRDEPDMFLAYNNGISVTAEGVEIVPRISAFANTQNKVQIADFSANDPYHRRIEELSRTVWAPAQGGLLPQNWFYERARGQYADMLARETTTLRRKKFKETHPLFTKTDLAKYENTWDQLPFYVSEGAQKNFRRFTVRLSQAKAKLPDETYYQHLISKAILFKQTEKLVSKQQYGGYRANIVTYTLAFLSFKTAQRIDLDKIWREQGLSPVIENEIIEISKFIQRKITNPPGGANVGEWCKKEKCWKDIKEYPYNVSEKLEKELIATDCVQKTAVNSIESLTEDQQTIINEAYAVPAQTWLALSKWAKETHNFQPWQRSLLFSVGTLVGREKKPSIKQSVQALKVYKQALEKGFLVEEQSE